MKENSWNGWEVYADADTKKRSCCYGYAEMTEDERKELEEVGELPEGTPVPFSEWTCTDAKNVMSSMLEDHNRHFLSTRLPDAIETVCKEAGLSRKMRDKIMRIALVEFAKAEII